MTRNFYPGQQQQQMLQGGVPEIDLGQYVGAPYGGSTSSSGQQQQPMIEGQFLTRARERFTHEREMSKVKAVIARAHYPLNLPWITEWREWFGILLIEAFAAMIFVMIAGLVTIHSGGDVLLVALSLGGTLAGLLFLLQDVTGVHLFFWLSFIETVAQKWDEGMMWVGFLFYTVGQLSGAIGGAALVLAFEGSTSSLGIPTVGTPAFNHWHAWGAEIAGAFFIGLVYLMETRYTDDMRPHHGHAMRPLAIGGAYAASFAAFSLMSGGSFNFIRWFGPAVIHPSTTDWSQIWIWLTGPMIGITLAAIVVMIIVRIFRTDYLTLTPGGPVGEKMSNGKMN